MKRFRELNLLLGIFVNIVEVFFAMHLMHGIDFYPPKLSNNTCLAIFMIIVIVCFLLQVWAWNKSGITSFTKDDNLIIDASQVTVRSQNADVACDEAKVETKLSNVSCETATVAADKVNHKPNQPNTTNKKVNKQNAAK